MLRPKLRPTLSRKTKYWGIAPTAQKKLGREARRGSHDLRKLVGHANFLDVLIEQLAPEDDDAAPTATRDETRREAIEQPEEFEEWSSSASDSEEWSDDSDDEEHSLSLTRSHVVGVEAEEAYDEVQTSPSEDGDDYFQLSAKSNPVVQMEAMAIREEVTAALSLHDDQKAGDVSIVVTSVSETPLASPTDDPDGKRTRVADVAA